MSEIKYFYIRQLTYPLSPHAQAMWHWLMWKLNAAFWCQPMKISVSEIAGAVKMSPTMVKRARKELVDGGYLLHEAQGGAKPASYCVLSCVRPGIVIAPNNKTKSLGKTDDEAIEINTLN